MISEQAATVQRKHRIPDQPLQPVFDEPEQLARLRAPQTRYKPEFCQDAMEIMAQGFSLGGMAGKLGIARSTVNRWFEAHPEFSEACARARSAQQYYWEKRFIFAVETGANPQGPIFALVNCGREDWKNRQEIEHTGEIKLSAIIETAMQRIAAARTIEGTLAAPDLDTCF
jgi:Bacteriophage Sf6, terminase small subunit-like